MITTVRHDLHRHPELALQEFGTSRYIRSKLANHGIFALERDGIMFLVFSTLELLQS